MKELSIEQKAKAYDMALEKARQLCAYPTTKPFISGLQDLFPELKESEDERIRKEIISYLKRRIKMNSSIPAAIGYWITWLEKQGEQKPNYCHHEVDLSDCSEEYRKAYYDGWNNCNQQHAQLGAEQNPTWSEEKRKEFIGELQSLMFEWSNKKENMGVCIDRHIDKLLSIVSDISDLKPAWSEEDESLRLRTIGALETCKIGSPTKCVDEQINWLKSLKDRVQPQSKQEWSEEDERTLSSIYQLIDFIPTSDSHLSKEQKEIYLNWLKSLRPQNKNNK